MGQKQARKKHERRVEELVAAAEAAATRAEKAARKARRERKRAAEAPRPAGTTPVPTEALESTAAPTSELESATKAELMERARAADVTGRGSMTKAELVAALGG